MQMSRMNHPRVPVPPVSGKEQCAQIILSVKTEVEYTCSCLWRHCGLMDSVLVSGSSGPGSSPSQGHCVVSLGKTLYSHIVSLHPGVEMSTSKFSAGGNPGMD